MLTGVAARPTRYIGKGYAQWLHKTGSERAELKAAYESTRSRLVELEAVRASPAASAAAHLSGDAADRSDGDRPLPPATRPAIPKELHASSYRETRSCAEPARVQVLPPTGC